MRYFVTHLFVDILALEGDERGVDGVGDELHVRHQLVGGERRDRLEEERRARRKIANGHRVEAAVDLER